MEIFCMDSYEKKNLEMKLYGFQIVRIVSGTNSFNSLLCISLASYDFEVWICISFFILVAFHLKMHASIEMNGREIVFDTRVLELKRGR